MAGFDAADVAAFDPEGNPICPRCYTFPLGLGFYGVDGSSCRCPARESWHPLDLADAIDRIERAARTLDSAVANAPHRPACRCGSCEAVGILRGHRR
jgi:hypothetical protein